ncbi:hypothetical protein F2Q69_00013119 [Brassica cretica]|uniref:Secreted protein n=1 Tax=Brassica cretica TaxID=69181 RepID=A0A8S9R1C2_BRACR|nr:hypothetical protein F2Q69_00013119 [Brassica cretica]
MGILVTLCGFWASIGLEMCLAHVLASLSIDGKGAPSIDSPSSPRQLPLARQTGHSSVKQPKSWDYRSRDTWTLTLAVHLVHLIDLSTLVAFI